MNHGHGENWETTPEARYWLIRLIVRLTLLDTRTGERLDGPTDAPAPSRGR